MYNRQDLEQAAENAMTAISHLWTVLGSSNKDVVPFADFFRDEIREADETITNLVECIEHGLED